MPTYKNRNTGVTVTYSEARPRLESLPQWEQVDDPDDTTVTDAATGRAEAERASIEEAARHRSSRAERYHEEALEISKASAEARENVSAPNVTLSHLQPAGYTAADGVLTRAKGDHDAGRLQIGDDPDAHPRTREGLEAKAAADSARIAAARPEDEGVLKRAWEPLPDADTVRTEAAGGQVEWQEVEEKARAREEEASTDTDTTESSTDAEPETAADEVQGERPMPRRNGSVNDWRAYAVEVHDADPEAVESMGRDELIERYGQKQ